MIHEETIQKLLELKLVAMATAARELATSPPDHQLTTQEVLGMMVDREHTHRDNRRLARRLKEARLPANAASVEEVTCEAARGLDKAVVRSLATCQWVRSKQNVIIVGATGTGKTFLGTALAQAACRSGLRALCTRAPRLLHDLAIARGDGSYSTMLQKIARADVLVLDDLLIAPLKEHERRDLLEVLEDRYDRASTVITTQVPTKSWHESLADPTIADAICDRVIHNAHVVTLRGGSMRKKKGLGTEQT
ncbi:MAG: IS21-like element helper ATPase IstB [Phycisphaeraceae bacterium]|nr:IS21-like element helper ATPase IstB [Phycisphaeraceae bacterium]